MPAQEDHEAGTEHNIEVVLRFSPSAVRRLKETIWYSTQQIKDLPDGSCLFTASVGNNSIMDIVPWIRGWGSAVEVLEPEALRKKMAEEARVMEKMYREQEQQIITALDRNIALYSHSSPARSVAQFLQRRGRAGRAPSLEIASVEIPIAVSQETTASSTKIPPHDKHDDNADASSSSDKSSVLKFLESASFHLNQHRQERLYQAHISFKISVIALIVGLLLIGMGIICVFAFNVQVGIVTTLSGAFADFIGIGILRFNKEANDRLDITTRELNLLDRTSIAMHYIERITDPKEKNEAIRDLAKQLYTQLPEHSNTRESQ